MQVLSHIVLVVHFLGLAAIIGTFLTQMRPPRPPSPGYLHGSLTQLVTGVLLVGLIYAQDGQPDNAKITVKLLITLAILGLYLANRKKEQLPTGVWGAIGALAISNVAIAVLWS